MEVGDRIKLILDKERSPELPVAASVDSDDGQDLLDQGWEATEKEFQRNLDRVKEGIEELSDEAIMRDGDIVRHAFHQIGAYDDPSIFLYDEHACGIRHRGRIDQILNESDDIWIVPADVHLGDASTLLQLIIDNREAAGNETLQRALEYSQEQAGILHDDENFYSERNRLDQAIPLPRALGHNGGEFEARIVDSWDAQLDTEFEGGSTRDFVLVGRAMQECKDFASSSKLDEWKRDMQEIAPQAVEGMTEVEHSIGVEHGVIDALADGVKALADQESPVFALFSFAHQWPHVKAFEKRDAHQPGGIRDVFNRVKISEMGTTGPTDYRTGEEVEAVLMEQIVTNAFRECFDRGVIFAGSVIDLVERFAGLEEDDVGYFDDLIGHFENEEYIAAYHIGLPHFERVLRKMLNAQDESIIALKPDGTITSALGTLLVKLEAYSDTRYAEYLQYKYTDRSGQNRRNLAAHGLVSDDQVDGRLSTGLILDILTVGCDLNREELVSELGAPEIPSGW